MSERCRKKALAPLVFYNLWYNSCDGIAFSLTAFPVWLKADLEEWYVIFLPSQAACKQTTPIKTIKCLYIIKMTINRWFWFCWYCSASPLKEKAVISEVWCWRGKLCATYESSSDFIRRLEQMASFCHESSRMTEQMSEEEQGWSRVLITHTKREKLLLILSLILLLILCLLPSP